jgi:hypothetical protein
MVVIALLMVAIAQLSVVSGQIELKPSSAPYFPFPE